MTFIAYSVGILFIAYHIFYQPRLFRTPKNIVVETIFQFCGVLVIGVLLYVLFIKLAELATGEIPLYIPYLLLMNGCILVLIDLIILLNRNSQFKAIKVPEIRPIEWEKEKEKITLETERLEKEIEVLKNENKAFYDTIEKLNKNLFDFNLQKEELNQKEENLKKWRKEYDLEKLQKEQTTADHLKQIKSDYQKRFDESILEIKQNYQESYNKKMAEFMDSVTEKLEKRILSEKKNLVDDVFKFDGSSRDDIFELKRTKENMDKEKETIEKNKFKLELDDLVSKSKEHVLEAKTSALDVKSENVDLRSDLKLMAGEFKNELLVEKTSREKSIDAVLHKLELEEERRKSDTKDVGNKIALLGEQTKGQLIELASVMNENLRDLEMKTMNSFREVRENLSDMKLQFGQEILRLDGQQGQILNELEKYYIKNQEFVNKCQGLALEARKQNIEGSNLLNQINHMYNQHRVETKEMENKLQSSLDQVAVKEGHLANSIGESMLKLKSISDQQYIAAKDLALEKKDSNLLWREKNIEHDMNMQEVRHQKQDLERYQQSVNQSINDKVENARQIHQKFMMQQRYEEALKKAQSSQSILGRIARAADNAINRS